MKEIILSLVTIAFLVSAASSLLAEAPERFQKFVSIQIPNADRQKLKKASETELKSYIRGSIGQKLEAQGLKEFVGGLSWTDYLNHDPGIAYNPNH